MRSILRIISMVFIILAGASLWAAAQRPGGDDPVVQRIFLVGDAGELKGEAHPVCDWLKQHVDWNDSNNVLVYLGDNIYPQGMPSEGNPDRDRAKKILDYQVSVVAGKNAKAFFVPGNHDWRQGKPGGWQQVKNEGDYLESLGLPNVEMIPRNGCPGPVVVRVGEKVVLVGMDSQWWLQNEDDRPGAQSDCDCKDPKAVVNALRDIIGTYPDKLIVLAMHHPFYTHGQHGGYYTLREHLFPLTDLQSGLYIPLPVIGSIYPIARGVFGNIQDLPNPKYKDLREEIEEVIKGHPNVVHVAGHEHTLQLLEHDSTFFVVSGAGSKNTRVKMGENSLFAREELGFAVIEVHASGRPEIRFLTADAGDLGQSVYRATMPTLLSHVDTQMIVGSFPDSVTVTGYKGFLVGGFNRWLLGTNYRKEWAAPVRVKVFDLSGYSFLQRGGGLQTRSLRIKDARGKEWVIRGVEKYVTDNALPVALQGDPFVKDLVSDGVSASYPYAALSIPSFATALQVPHANPTLVYIPDDPRLGRFRSDYGNLFAFVEEREPGNGKKTYNFEDLDKKLQDDNDNTVNQAAVLKARLMDMFFMDFDRHEDQWRWMADDNGKGKTFSPVPRDRDQPFFTNSGLLPWIAGSAWAAPQLQGFRAKARNIKTFNFNARNFDRNNLSEPAEKQWHEQAEALLALMTDSLIESALNLQPPFIQPSPYAMSSIIATLKARRKYYMADVMTYYKFLARQVSVYGSNKRELFDIDRKADGTVTVTIYKLSKEGEEGKKIYQRVFVSGETREVRLYGLGGDDQFHNHGEGSPIIIRIIGGPGNDLFDNEASAAAVKTKIYDLSTEKNEFKGDGGHRSFLSKDPAVNAVNRLGYKYNVIAPLLSVAYNPDDGVFLGAGFRYTVQGFHKEPYKQLHNLMIEHALATDAFAFRYNFEAIHAIGSLDLLLNADIKAPNNTINFFGYGNETFYDRKAKEGIRYYRARFNVYDVDGLLRKRMGSVFSISAGPAFQYFTLDSADNKDRYINQPGNGVDHSTLYSSRSYVGGRVMAVVDDRNNKILPSRGIDWVTGFSSYGGLNNESHAYSQLNSALSLFTSFNTRGNFVISTRVGWGKTFGDHEFYQSQFLGGTDNLRGYRKFRFAGDESFYNNLDLRFKLAEFRTYLFPGSLGLNFFNDVGRVWFKGEDSHLWHDGYGGGIWIAPLKKFVFSASYGKGTEGGVVLVKLGFQY